MLFQLETEHLLLVHTPNAVIETRLERADFFAPLETRAGTLTVHFPPEWPGDALEHFPAWLEHRKAHPHEREFGGGTVVLRGENIAVGQLGFHGPPNEAGEVEIGYGFVPACWGRGYATEMVRAQVQWALEQNGVYRVKAECLRQNLASSRVLEKCGFARVGERFDEGEGGWLVLWERR